MYKLSGSNDAHLDVFVDVSGQATFRVHGVTVLQRRLQGQASFPRHHHVYLWSGHLGQRRKFFSRMCRFAGAAETRYPNWRLRQQKCVASSFWRLEVSDQGVGRIGSF